MKAMDAKRPAGRVAEALAACVSLIVGWAAIASAPDRGGRVEEVAATEDAVLVIDAETAEALAELEVIELFVDPESGGTQARFAASVGGPSIIVVGSIEALPIAPPAIMPTLPAGSGYFYPRREWPRPWRFVHCVGTGLAMNCVYQQQWVVAVDVACVPGPGSVRHFYTFTYECRVPTSSCESCEANPDAVLCPPAPVVGWQTCLPIPAGGPPPGGAACIPGVTVTHSVHSNCP
jgi:hypothetical protein